MLDDLPLTTKNEVRRYECQSWGDFIEKVRTNWPLKLSDNNVTTARRVYFRGHADSSWKLVSKLDRQLQLESIQRSEQSGEEPEPVRFRTGLASYQTYCAEILESFRHLVQGLPDMPRALPDDELWALGRHFGLFTPLLDWSESPYVAAFFAFEPTLREWDRGYVDRPRNREGTVTIWGLRFWGAIEKEGEFDLMTAFPPGVGRQRAQRGVFTRLQSEDHDDIESYLRSGGFAHCLEQYILPKRFAVDVLRDLSLMNIVPATMFPDLTGAAQQANLDSVALASSGFYMDFMIRMRARKR